MNDTTGTLLTRENCLFAIVLEVRSAWILHTRIIRDRSLHLEEKSEVNKLPVGSDHVEPTGVDETDLVCEVFSLE